MQNDSSKNGRINIFLTVLAIVAVFIAIFFSYRYYNLVNDSEGNITKTVMKDLGKLLDLPDEQPAILIVEDKDSLNGVKFFDESLVGDYVLIYTEEQIAILYRPSEKKIIKVVPVYINEEKSEDLKFIVRNSLFTSFQKKMV